MDRILFTQALIVAPHLFSSGLSRMVYQHLLKCFIPEDPSLGFSKLFQVVTIACGDIFKSMALVLGANRLLVMVKDTRGFHLIVIGKMFFSLLIIPLSSNFKGCCKSTYPPISLEYGPMEVCLKRSLMSSKAYTLTF
jgi:hypothetical protein